MTDLSLKSFRWYRSPSGYRVLSPKDAFSPRIFANEFRTVAYSPFAHAGNLYELFARVRDQEQLLDFVTKFGLLFGAFETKPRKQIKLPATLDLDSLVAEDDVEKIREYGRDFVMQDKFSLLLYDSEFGGEEIEKDLKESEFFRSCMENSARPRRLRQIITEYRHIFCMAVVPGHGRDRAIDFRLDLHTLLDALKFQMFQKVVGEVNFRACLFCNEWFEVGAGTGRRLDAKFCSDEHRILFNSRKRNKSGQ